MSFQCREIFIQSGVKQSRSLRSDDRDDPRLARAIYQEDVRTDDRHPEQSGRIPLIFRSRSINVFSSMSSLDVAAMFAGRVGTVGGYAPVAGFDSSET